MNTTVTARLLGLAELGYAHWLFGNIYEAAVRMPERLAGEPHTGSVLGPGSPLRYYAPLAPVTLATTAAAVRTGWDIGGARRWLALMAAGSTVGVALSGYLIRTVNLPVMFAADPPPPAQRDALIRTWYVLNGVRIVATGAALFAAHRARSGSFDR
ncbi:hypothetical protein [Mycobacterium sp.]|uniref:hypothetical protein n=1 Tax=Mycobacterium sp. TaxID=1785 RepID=UPI0025D65CBE|nr:hypothetical protein [Mycobacterium sp.]MBW0014039.1 hypothetical protein [Mycobacterium sp.]